MRNKLYSLRCIRGLIPVVIAGLAMPFASIGRPAAAQQSSNARYVRAVLPAGTVIPVQLNTSLNSKDNQRGDRFSATVKTGRDDAGLPEGTRIEGIVQDALPSGNGKAGELDVDFRRIVFPDGNSQQISASLYSLDGKAVKQSDGRLIATSDKSKDRLKWIGIGAGGGLLIGALTKQNELFAGLLGAGAGYLFNELSNKRPGDVNLKQGSTFGVRLDRELAFNADARSYANRQLDNSVDPNYDRNAPRNGSNNDPYYDRNSPRNGSNGGQYYDRNSPRNGDSNDATYYRNRRQRDNNRNGSNSDSYTTGNIGMEIDGNEVRFSRRTAPYMRDGVVFVPLAATGRAAMFDYRYDSDEHVIYARDDSVRLTLGNREGMVDGRRGSLPAAAEMRNGSVYVPMQFIGWAVDGSAKWNSENRMVIVTTTRNR